MGFCWFWRLARCRSCCWSWAVSDLPYSDRLLIDVVNVVVLVAFAVDYLVELRLARDRRRFVRHEWTSLLIVVSQMIAVVPGFQAIGILRALRGVRGMRAALVLLRLLAIGGATARESRTYLRKHAASLALGVAGLSWLTAAAAFTLVEDVGVDGRLHSFFDALWWSTATITTVGYGDVFPSRRRVGSSVASRWWSASLRSRS